MSAASISFRGLSNPLRSIGLLATLAASPVVAIFLATNAANVGNLAFNMLFSRLLGPAQFHDLAVMLTIQLAVLSVFGAAQMAVSQLTASGLSTYPNLARLTQLSRVSFLVLLLAAVLLSPLAFSEQVAATLGIEDRSLLVILLLSLPVSLPLCLARGAALGRLSVRAMVVSVNLEMVIRLVGSVAVWFLGFGLPGIVLVVNLSLIAGWWPVRRETSSLKQGWNPPRRDHKLAPTIALMAAPFALLQLAQVGHLDGELLLSKMLLSDHESDLVAGLSLVQRIQFYACFGLAGVLLPLVVRAVREGRSVEKSILGVASIIVCTGSLLTIAALSSPDMVISVVAGVEFRPAGSALVPAILSAFFFTVSYTAATLLAAMDDRSGIAMIALALPVALCTHWIASTHGTLEILMWAKAFVQFALCCCLMLRVGRAILLRLKE
ncbi:MAG: hypothetical protein AAFY99_14510 [Pseudomonadota bacterium]